MAQLRTPNNYPAVIREAWAAHEVFRVLGFSADDLYFVVARSAESGGEKLGVYVQLRRKDVTLFTFYCGPLGELREHEVGAKWQAFVQAFNDRAFRDKDLWRIFDASLARAQAIPMIADLSGRGLLPTQKP